MNFLSLTPDYSGGLPAGAALLHEWDIVAYQAAESGLGNRLKGWLMNLKKEPVVVWSQTQQTQLYELLGDEPGFSFVCLQESLQHFGLESLTLASACLRLGLQEPGGDALSQAFTLHLVTKQVGLTLPEAI